MTQTELVVYNVECVNCGSIWQPQIKSPLWWRAKKREEDGKLDAVGATGEECGCIKRVSNPNAPFRVLGYDDMGGEFDQPFATFVSAVRAFKNARSQGDIVFIMGVSDAVQEKIKWML
jgi:hypothetical protein